MIKCWESMNSSQSETSEPVDLRTYTLVTAAYWGFTLTDGALRLLVLLYFNELGYSPLQVAALFILYEFFGVLTNLFGGWILEYFPIGLRIYQSQRIFQA